MGVEECIFCKIVAGEIPCYKVYEDEEYLGFLDIKPLTPGHVLVVPKKHIQRVDDVPRFGEYFEVAKKVGLAQKKALGAFMVCYLTLGFEVPHAHIRVVPRYKDDGHGEVIKWELTHELPVKQMEDIAGKISKATGL